MSSWSHSKYVRKAEKKLAQSEKKKGLRPVIIESGVTARTWWGKAWNRNLESSADYASVLGRGRSVAQCGAILDLQASEGEIKALVQGSRTKPYAVTITIDKMNKNTWILLASACKGRLESLDDLLAGKFSKAVEEKFMQQKSGLFPSTREIAFSCTCPDWASMCKHIAATFYGIGVRIDENPEIFFTLRGVNADDLIKRAVSSKAKDYLQKTSTKSSRTTEGVNLSSVHGGDLGEESGPPSSEVSVEIQTPGAESVRMADVRLVLKKQLKMDVKLAKKEKVSKKSGAKKLAVTGTANEIVSKVVRKRFRPE